MRLNSDMLARTGAIQKKASDPQASAFVRANAGSGKTHVLTQRVLRLLLAGTPPAKILCLTFTKAAAANMSSRVFDALAGWTALGDEDLRGKILETGAENPDGPTLRRARVLFAQTVETPGGLKIQTIHAFCDRLLHLFPFEANVPAGFEQADTQREAAMLAAAQRQCLAQAQNNVVLEQKLRIVARHASQGGFAKVLRDALKHRTLLAALLHDHPTPQGYAAFLAKRLGLARAVTPEAVLEEITGGGIERRLWPELALLFAEGTKAEGERGQAFARAAAAPDAETAATLYMDFFLTEALAPRKRLVTAGLKASYPDLLPMLEAEQVRLGPMIEKLNAARALERSAALAGVLDDILGRYERMKAYAGLLDFDDLISRTLGLLTRSDAAWVLYKLDAGIDHILVDEAQDTSPGQWKILEQISADFVSGAGAREVTRSFFAVGDEKQSIFSFQGAAPAEFDRMRRHFRLRLEGTGRFVDEKLENSFRSAAAVIESVDTVFSSPENYQGLSAGQDEGRTVHQNIKTGLPGIVEFWPLAEAEPPAAAQGWRIPDTFAGGADPATLLARRIAVLIKSWLSPDSIERVADDVRKDVPPAVNAGDVMIPRGASEPAEWRPRRINAGDVMILVRSRSAFFEAMIRACKQQGVPVAGADRLRILEHLSVEDLAAAARIALLPQDDLTLAAVLKSPLIGLDEDELFTLASGRGGSLWQSLLDHAATSARMAAAAATIAGWREAAAATPFDFFAGVLGPGGGRRRLLARLGREAEDAIDEFLSYALEWQRQNTASLVAFTASLAQTQIEIKRDLEAAGGAVRVMTVHGAKGLEAKIVFLPDTCSKGDSRNETSLFVMGDPPALVWAGNKRTDCAALARARELREAARDDEYRRLLYVALTRAEERLYLAGYLKSGRRSKGCWHEMIEATLVPGLSPAPAPWDASQTVLRRADPWPAQAHGEKPAAGEVSDVQEPLPAWLTLPPPHEARRPSPLRPSHALAGLAEPEPAASDTPRGRALKRGGLVHMLLQHLPPLAAGSRRGAAQACLAQRASWLRADEAQALIEETLGVLDDPAAAALFGPDSVAEAAIAGEVALGQDIVQDIAGQIDRLAVTPAEIVYADYKTGMPAPGAAPLGYVTQLALYGAVLAQLYPGHRLRALLVWTAGPLVEEIAPERLSSALASHARRSAHDGVSAPAP